MLILHASLIIMKTIRFFRKYKPAIRITALAIGILVITFALFRNPLLRWYAKKKINYFNNQYHCAFSLEGLRFSGLTGIWVQKAQLNSPTGDTLLLGEDIHIKLGLGKSIHPTAIQGKMFLLYLSYEKGNTNWSFIFKEKSSKTDTIQHQPIDLSSRARILSRLLFHYLPDLAQFSHFEIRASYEGVPLKISSDSLIFSNKPFNNHFRLMDDSTDFDLKVEGYLNRSTKQGGVKIFPENQKRQWLPFLTRAAATGVNFDTLKINFIETHRDKKIYQILLKGEVVRLRADNRALSDDIVTINHAAANVGLIIQKNIAETDGEAIAVLNGLRLPFSASLQLKPQPVIRLNINTGWLPASHLFDALPEGLFDNLHEIRVKGDLAYHLKVELDTQHPDSLVFESKLNQRNFSILSFGRTPLNLMNEPFLYTAYEKGKPVRSFIVGPENPNFIPLEQIPQSLQHAVLTSEDGGFFQHNGFLPDAFREAMIANLKAGKFVRGGSTISMQLVKNVFLNRHKTIIRKLEEALIVWLIENKRITSKERMFEVYLNIIEWGPLIYGIKEASWFYFNKKPGALTLAESIFLASIIPSPKKFMYYVDGEGHPKPLLQNYYRLMGTKMVAKGFLTEDQLPLLDPFSVKIKGPAVNYLPQADTLPADSLQVVLPLEGI
ncbi:MAG: hypothetical protein PWP35_71 [Bacteroidales bacterium]|nr:hypothetical protein [Bacteroidales bacterium]